ncbi:hypothetical protein PVAND_003278 [Polypedilum vanderplanki]|uniref:CN hydrolase domain-containing protein n=1 Tax=Polypedilum vanderplanki TaxID=319348 RepID=A0A9J6BVB4_POLVA|nr:hypothetical protein PVAND_003278 [Polypedilum vanderplanki]
MWLVKILLLIFIKTSIQASDPSSFTYKAGVVELNVSPRPDFERNSTQWTKQQLSQYLEILHTLPEDLDILVFPESTLNALDTAFEIPEVNDKIVACNNSNYEDDNLIKIFSCEAIIHKVYIVINLVTKAKCPDPEMIVNNDPRNCNNRPDGFSYYNTNIVFDRNGTLISRYRKYHLYNEQVDRPLKPTMEYFDTDFGVRFGHFICFDIAYQYPALELVRNYNLTDIVYPTMWFSELPYLTAIQVQQNWAYANNVNLLAAGANNIQSTSTGSGIYGGKKGAYVLDMAGTSKTELHTATVYKIKDFLQNENEIIEHKVVEYTKEELRNLTLLRDPMIDHPIEFLDDTIGEHYASIGTCKNSFCCNINVNYTIPNLALNNRIQYGISFFHGIRSFHGVDDGGIVVCTVVACLSKNISTCGLRNDSLENIHIWNSINIEAEFLEKNNKYLYFPNTLNTAIVPLQPKAFDYQITDLKNDKIKITMKLHGNQNIDNLITFGIYGRDFTLDNGVIQKVSILLMTSLLMVYFGFTKMF